VVDAGLDRAVGRLPGHGAAAETRRDESTRRSARHAAWHAGTPR
jgi:hypothetical protein